MGLITTRQIAELGFDRVDIERFERQDVLTRRHRGVYLIGDTPLTWERKLHAAQLAIGPKGAIAQRTALLDHMLRTPEPDEPDEVHIAIQGRGGRERRNGLVIHRPLSLPPDDIEARPGHRVTAPTRTLLDTAAQLPRYARFRAMEAAEFHRLHIERARLDAHPPMRQALALLDRVGACTRSDAEAMFLFICVDHGIPLPLVNVIHEDIEWDFRWPQRRLIVEVDGFGTHDGRPLNGRERFERDRDKGAIAELLGYHFTRFSARQVSRERALVARVVGQRLRP